MREDITEHLKQKYQPDAIILHGSRARGKEREHSDWDFILLYKSPVGEIHKGRAVYESQNIEFSSHILPIDDIEKEFSIKLQGAKVVYEESNEGTALLEKANTYYQKGVHWSNEKTSDHKLWLQGRIDGMRDSIERPIVFQKYLADFYQRVFNYWYWILQHSHSQPIYIAVEEVEKRDPEYFTLVSQLSVANTSPIEKIQIAEKIRDRLFP